MTTFQNIEIPRDRYQRPLIVPPGDDPGAKRIAYRRVTTFIKALEDTYNIEQWAKRLVAYGMGQRHDLQLAASALSLDESHKKKLQRIADDALENAQGSAAATIGTALHGHTETLDRGQELGFIPPPYDKDIEAYQRATYDIQWLGVESFRVKDDWQIAGTADRIGVDKHGRKRIYDVKTGQTAIQYPHSIAAQLAMYSRCQPYDIATDTRQPIEEGLDQNTAVIIWLPAGKGICELHEVDIAKGWGACLLAKQVWAWRNTKDLIEPLREAGPAPTWETVIESACSLADLRLIWERAQAGGYLDARVKGMCTQRAQEITYNNTAEES